MKMVLAIAAGGAIGAVSRYGLMHLISLWTVGTYPFGTLAVNIIGSFLMGCFLELSALAYNPSPEMRAFITIGVLGSLTTFSTFSMDAVALGQKHAYFAMSGYIIISVICAILAFCLGLFIIRNIVLS